MLEFIIKYWIQILFGALISLITYLVSNYKQKKNKIEYTTEGLKMLIKSKICEIYNKAKEKKCINFYEKKVLSELYKSYQDLGGNGFIDDIINDINTIDLEENC